MIAKVREIITPGHAPEPQMQGRPARGSRCLTAFPKTLRGLDAPSEVDMGDRCSAAAAARAPLFVDEAPLCEIVQGRPPVRRAEPMGNHATVAQDQRDRPVSSAVARRRHVGAGAVLVKISAQGGNDGAQAHQNSPRDRKLAVPSRPTMRWSCT